MSPIQCIVALTTGLFVPPMMALAKPAPETPPQPTIVKLAPADGQNTQPRMLMLHRALDGNATNDDTNAAREIEAGGPWIGVQFGPIPKPLRAHLNLAETAGQMVLNVAEGSPADIAGLKQYDVITNIDGRDAAVDMAQFLDLIRSFTPNETHQFGLIRGGAAMTQRVVVGTRPADWNNLKYRYEVEQEPMAGTQLFRRGGMLEKDPQGNWQFKNLDQLKDMQDLWKYMPQFNADDLQFSWQRAMPGGQNQMRVYVNKGNEIRIEKNEDGKITVTKTDRENDDESTTTATYDDEAAFEKADPETYKTYKGGFGAAGKGDLHYFFGQNPHGQFGPHGQPFNFQFDMKELHEAADAMRRDAEAAQNQATNLRNQLEMEMARQQGSAGQTQDAGKSASTSFEVEADGSVRVVTRSGDSELVRRFNSLDQMKTTSPDLFEKYESVRSGAKE